MTLPTKHKRGRQRIGAVHFVLWKISNPFKTCITILNIVYTRYGTGYKSMWGLLIYIAHRQAAICLQKCLSSAFLPSLPSPFPLSHFTSRLHSPQRASPINALGSGLLSLASIVSWALAGSGGHRPPNTLWCILSWKSCFLWHKINNQPFIWVTTGIYRYM